MYFAVVKMKSYILDTQMTYAADYPNITKG
ncbi:MAG: hypothetical protein UY89_C0003G0019 [Parcubacteria group bacterium GW2011_GWA1_54_9]|nr:MAG: hypothetical protein UY89_C0003G0019 [Parcubacteria group bacterium GW2011_GWA1_54_9]KKW42076.1 MAG: hypothetical protein UY91_C0007G0020 [Parcubacteria group bacterium GW2011_GWB1_55_9]